MRRHHGSRCGCGGHQRPKKIVHPVKENVVHCCTEETIEHIHPSHTTVVNHHLTKNKHFFPHSTSVKNTWDSVDECGGSCNKPNKHGHGHHRPPHIKPCNKPNKWW